MKECPRCGTGYFGAFEASPERMEELRRPHTAPHRDTCAAGLGVALALIGVAFLIVSLPWLAVIGVVLLVLGWASWKGSEL